MIYYCDQKSFISKHTQDSSLEIKLLSGNDIEAFKKMKENCSEEDLDAGFVELDHSLVAGVFDKTKLIACASAYPFMDSQLIYDIGYITDPNYRGHGHASLSTSYLVEKIFSNGKIPQIRMQADLMASIKVSEKLGFKCYGEWQYDLQS